MILRLIVAGIRRLFVPTLSPGQIDARLRERASAHAARSGERLDPFQSIVDLMKLLDLDPSLHNRRALWGELGCDAHGEYSGTAEQNLRLIQELRARFAKGDFEERW